MGAQIVIHSYVDSVAGFTCLFVAVSTVAHGFAASSPRLAYLRAQIIVPSISSPKGLRNQILLGIARDSVVGILLGLFVMWLVFDQLWAARSP